MTHTYEQAVAERKQREANLARVVDFVDFVDGLRPSELKALQASTKLAIQNHARSGRERYGLKLLQPLLRGLAD